MSGYPQSWDQPFTTPFDQGHQRSAQAGHPAYGQQPQGYAPQGYPQQPQGYAPQGYGAPGQDPGYDWSGFDPNEYEDNLAPQGTHVFQITDAEMKTTKKGGLMLALRLEFQNGLSAFTNFNIRNDNPDAERIGKQQLVKLLKCVGLTDMRGGIQSLVKRTGTVTVTHKEDKTGTMRDNFAWKPAQAQAPMGAPVPQPMAQPMPQMAPAPQWAQPAPQPVQQPVPQPQPVQYPQPVPGMSTAPGLPQDGSGMMRPIEQLPSQQLPPLDPQFAQPRPNPFQQR
jgi:hypothetical protein